MSSGLRNLRLNAIEVDALRRNPVQRLVVVIPQLSELLVIPEKVLRGLGSYHCNYADNGIAASVYAASPFPLYRVVLNRSKTLRPHAAGDIVLRQYPNRMALWKLLQRSSNGEAVANPKREGLRIGERLLRSVR